MSHAHDYSESKFTELLIHVADLSKDDPGFGAVKLHKLLFFSEFRAYRDLGRAISGVEFQNLEHGPAARRLLPVQSALEHRGDVRIAQEPTPAGVQRRLVALRPADLSVFSEEELTLVRDVVREFWGATAAEVTRVSHEEAGWIATAERETIPYHMALLSRPQPTPDDVEFAREALRRAGLSDHS